MIAELMQKRCASNVRKKIHPKPKLGIEVHELQSKLCVMKKSQPVLMMEEREQQTGD